MERIYKNEFTGLVRKFSGSEDSTGWNLQDDGSWVKTGMTEKQVKRLPYYKLQEQK